MNFYLQSLEMNNLLLIMLFFTIFNTYLSIGNLIYAPIILFHKVGFSEAVNLNIQLD